MKSNFKIDEIDLGKDHICQYETKQMLDTFGRIPGLTDTPLRGLGNYVGRGVITARDRAAQVVEVADHQSNQTIIVKFDEITDIEKGHNHAA